MIKEEGIEAAAQSAEREIGVIGRNRNGKEEDRVEIGKKKGERKRKTENVKE